MPAFSYAEVRNIVFPVDGVSSFRDDFLEPRGGGTRQHLGVDVLADKMTPLVAAVDGVISYIPYPEPSYGYMITIQDKDGYQYRYIHINNDTPGTDDGNGGRANAYAPGLKRGSEVRAGELIGWVGDSGNAEQTVPHLHFEIRDPSRNALNPYDSLLAAAQPENVRNENIETPQVDVGEAGVAEGAEFVFAIQLRKGMQGDAIRKLQSRLKDEGFFTHPVTTKYFGSITEEALKKYQQANGIAPTGILGFETRTLLNQEENATPELRLEKELFEGDEGETVLQIKLKLETLGYMAEADNDVYDSMLREAVRTFQREHNLNPTGHVNFDTWRILNTRYASTPKPVAGPTDEQKEVYIEDHYVFRTAMSIGSRGEDVVALQCFLRDLGFFDKNTLCTGYFGPITHSAVAGFQASRGIEAIGIVGPKTRAALNSI